MNFYLSKGVVSQNDPLVNWKILEPNGNDRYPMKNYLNVLRIYSENLLSITIQDQRFYEFSSSELACCCICLSRAIVGFFRYYLIPFNEIFYNNFINFHEKKFFC